MGPASRIHRGYNCPQCIWCPTTRAAVPRGYRAAVPRRCQTTRPATAFHASCNAISIQQHAPCRRWSEKGTHHRLQLPWNPVTAPGVHQRCPVHGLHAKDQIWLSGAFGYTVGGSIITHTHVENLSPMHNRRRTSGCFVMINATHTLYPPA